MKKERNIQDIYPLSPMQEGLLIQTLLGDAQLYNAQITYHIEGYFESSLVERSLNELFDRHEVIRTAFIHEKVKEPIQVVLKKRKAEYSFFDIRNRPDKKQFLLSEMKKQETTMFDLSKDTLIRVAIYQLEENRYTFVWTHHHIIMDGWCISILLREFYEIYNALSSGKEINLPLATPYKNYIIWLGSIDQFKSKQYWKDYLDKFNGCVNFPKNQKNVTSEYKNETLIFDFGVDKSSQINELAATLNITVSSFFQVVWGICLAKYNSGSEAIFGEVVSGRPPEVHGIESIVGLFINTLPVRVSFDQHTLFADLAQQVHQNSLNKNEYQYLSLTEVQNVSELKENLIQTLFVIQNYPIDEEIGNSLQEEKSGEQKLLAIEGEQKTHYDFNVTFFPMENIQFKFAYNENVFSTNFVKPIAKHFKFVVDQVLNNPSINVFELHLIAPAEENEFVINPDKNYPKSENNLLDQFKTNVKEHPNKTAVKSDSTVLTYAELDHLSDVLMEYFITHFNVKKNDRVGVVLNRSCDLVVTLLAIHKSGAAYVPIDPDLSENRIRYILENSGVKGFVTNSEYYDNISDINFPLFLYDAQISQLTHTVLHIEERSNDSLAYVIYTSGSTGMPKGVMVEDTALKNLCDWHISEFKVTNRSSSTIYAGVGFDASTWEIWPYLISGATLFVFDDESRLNMNELLEFLNINQITHTFLPTKICEYLIQTDNITFPEEFTILTGGEALKNTNLPQVKIVNNYGLTECAVVSTFIELNSSIKSDIVPLGKPISNTQIYLLDQNMAFVPKGCVGEICIAGTGLGKGYINDEEKTKSVFVQNPYNEESRLYRSGDLGRLNNNGDIEFVGRIDDQIKIRGNRVELSEIEYHLLSYDKISEVYVCTIEDMEQKALVGYIVNNENIVLSELREFLSERVPDYMIPSFVVCLSELPLNINGKIDRDALPNPKEAALNNDNEFLMPETNTEKVLAQIWEEVLEYSPIGKNDNFFDRGGHSLKATRVMSRVYKMLNVSLELNSLFTSPTLKDLLYW